MQVKTDNLADTSFPVATRFGRAVQIGHLPHQDWKGDLACLGPGCRHFVDEVTDVVLTVPTDYLETFPLL